MLDVVPLGTGSALPTKTRHLSATAVRRDGRVVLFDCGEGTVRRLMEARLAGDRLDAVCITHLHGDHVYGLPGLLTTLGMLGRTRPLTLAGPRDLRAFIDAVPGLDADGMPFPITYAPLDDGFDHAVVYDDGRIRIEARPIEHRVFCVGYRLSEHARPGQIDGDAARAAGVTRGEHFEALKRGEAVTLDDGTRVSPDGLVGAPRPGAVVAYVLDTMPCPAGVALAQNADLLIHEATFGDAFAERAVEVGHSTARQAAEVAREAGARRLLITHFSARYGDVQPLVDEAREVFPETEAAVELAPVAVTPLRP